MLYKLFFIVTCASAVTAECFMRSNGAVRCKPCCLQRQKNFQSYSARIQRPVLQPAMHRHPHPAPINSMLQMPDSATPKASQHQGELSALKTMLKQQELTTLNSLLKQQELLSLNSLLKHQNSAVLRALMKQQDLTSLSSMLKLQDSNVLSSLLQLLNRVQITKQSLDNQHPWAHPAYFMPPWYNPQHSAQDAYLNLVTRKLLDRDDTSQIISLLNILLRIRQSDEDSRCPMRRKCSPTSGTDFQGTLVNFDNPQETYQGKPDRLVSTEEPTTPTTMSSQWMTTASSIEFTTTAPLPTKSYWSDIDTELIYNSTHLRNTAEEYYIPFKSYLTKKDSILCDEFSIAEGKTCFQYCDTFYKGHWLVVQHRTRDGTTEFNENWTRYQHGFGDLDNGYWMGLECLNQLTSKHICHVLIEITDSEGVVRVAHYGDFAVSSSHKDYMLKISRFLGGSAGDVFLNANRQTFKTADHGTLDETKCAIRFGGGWWFEDCLQDGSQSHLNGYFGPQNEHLGLSWGSLQSQVVIVKTRILIARTYGLAIPAPVETNAAESMSQSLPNSQALTENFETEISQYTTTLSPSSSTASVITSSSTTTTRSSTTTPTSSTSETTIPGVWAGLDEMGTMENNSTTLTLLIGDDSSITNFKFHNYSDVASAMPLENVVETAMNNVKIFYTVQPNADKLFGSQPERCPYNFQKDNKVCGNYGDSHYGGNWFVVQRRDLVTTKSFKRSWNDFVHGFGSWETGYWIGLECLHRLTEDLHSVELLVELTDLELNVAVAHYIGFSVGPAASNYALQYKYFLGGTAGDALVSSNSSSFSTIDKDNDLYADGNCVSQYGGGWWFNTCPPGKGNNLNADALAEGELVMTKSLWYTWQIDMPILRTKILLRQHSTKENELFLTDSKAEGANYKESPSTYLSAQKNLTSVSTSQTSSWSKNSSSYSSQHQTGSLAFVQAVSAYEYTFLSGLAYEAQLNAGKFYALTKRSKLKSSVAEKPPYSFVVQGKSCGRYGDKTYGRNWFLVQRRNASIMGATFDLPWEKYVEGFGGWAEGFWLGLECLYLMTNSAVHPSELFIVLIDANENVATAHYSGVVVEGPQADYRIHFDKFLGGSAGDSLYNINGRKFSSYDRDNDGLQTGNCAAKLRGGWWYDDCLASSVKNFLNSDFTSEAGADGVDLGVQWQTWPTKSPIVATKILLRVPTTDWLSLEEETF